MGTSHNSRQTLSLNQCATDSSRVVGGRRWEDSGQRCSARHLPPAHTPLPARPAGHQTPAGRCRRRTTSPTTSQQYHTRSFLEQLSAQRGKSHHLLDFAPPAAVPTSYKQSVTSSPRRPPTAHQQIPAGGCRRRTSLPRPPTSTRRALRPGSTARRSS